MPQVAIENAPASGSDPIRLPKALIIFLVWNFIGFLSYARYYLREPHHRFWPDVLIWAACYYPWALLTPAIFAVEKRFPLGRTRLVRNLSVLAVASYGFSYLGFVLSWELDSVRQSFVGNPFFGSHLWPLPSEAFWVGEFLCWSTFCASCILRRFEQLHEREREADRLALEKSKLEFSLKQAELETLRMRLNPHFLFNTLQNISVLAQQDPKTASQMITRLGDLLRTAFRRDAQPEVTLETEVSLTQAYVEVERMRFRERLSVRVEIAPGTEQSMVPTFLLQPLVENAIKHGLSELRITGQIHIRSAREEDRLVLSVSDNGTGLAAESLKELQLGVGLGSTCERLARMYPEKHELAVRRLQEGGTEVRVVLPFRLNVAPV
jgi:two-component system, LytTR family, sensor kinase